MTPSTIFQSLFLGYLTSTLENKCLVDGHKPALMGYESPVLALIPSLKLNHMVTVFPHLKEYYTCQLRTYQCKIIIISKSILHGKISTLTSTKRSNLRSIGTYCGDCSIHSNTVSRRPSWSPISLQPTSVNRTEKSTFYEPHIMTVNCIQGILR